MFWDKAAFAYDLFEDWYNGDVNRELCDTVAEMMEEEDVVLECACGTGMLSVGIAQNCKKLMATDYSEGMLKQAKRKCKNLSNVKIKKASILCLPFNDERFDKVVAANVIHLLDDPKAAIEELQRVCKPGGKIIIPTYVNDQNKKEAGPIVTILSKLGINFKRQFDLASYKKFFEDMGYADIEYFYIEGKMPNAIAVIIKD